MQVLLSQYTHVCKCTHVLDPIVHTSIFSWCYIHTLASHFILVCAVWRSRPPNRPCPASGDLRPPASRLRRPPLGTGTGPYYFCIIGGASLYYVLYKYKYVFVFIMYYVLCYPGCSSPAEKNAGELQIICSSPLFFWLVAHTMFWSMACSSHRV